MVTGADIHLPPGHTRALDLRMASEAEIEVALDQQLGVDAPVWVVADRAALAHRRMLKNKGPSLFPMALGAYLVPAGHG